MGSYFEWLQDLPFPMWIAEWESLWSFPFVSLSTPSEWDSGRRGVCHLHAPGRRRSSAAGVVARRLFFKISGAFLPQSRDRQHPFRGSRDHHRVIPDVDCAKLALIAAGMVLSVPIRTFVDGHASDGAIPSRVKGLAALSLVVWVAVITTGRLIAYVG